MIKNSSSLAMAALLLSGSITEEANATKVEQKGAYGDVAAVQLGSQQEQQLQLETAEELERKHRKSHKHAQKQTQKVD